MSKLALWEKVEKTNPANTKKVNQRGGFTSICAHSQIKAATEVFGPVGIGWGYAVTHSTIQAADVLLAVADVVLWHGDRANTFGSWRGMCAILEKGRIDDDAGKKAMTDALTKGLSHIGFNADVFLGLFDDNKYVQKVAQEFAKTEQQEQQQEPKPPVTDRFITGAINAIITQKTTKAALLAKYDITEEQMNTIDDALDRHDPTPLDSDMGYFANE